MRNGNLKVEKQIVSQYIRHQIHHPENTHDPRYTDVVLDQYENRPACISFHDDIGVNGVYDKKCENCDPQSIPRTFIRPISIWKTTYCGY